MAMNQEMNDRFCDGIKLKEFDSSKSDKVFKEIAADLLPDDPFGMGFGICLPLDPFGMDFNMESILNTFAGWNGDFGTNSSGFGSDESLGDDWSFVPEVKFVWTSKYEQENEGNMVDTDDLMLLGCEKYQNECVEEYKDAADGAPADALFFSLAYLGMKDLLTVERVCKSFRDAVRNDPILWRNVRIDYPLGNKITDDDLLRLTDRAQGSLCSLSLVKSFKITNVGLKRVLDGNPKLTKLSVPGCIRLKVEGILHDVKAFNSVVVPGIKSLRIGEMFGLTNQHFKEFKFLLGQAEDEEDRTPTNYPPKYYCARQMYLSLDDERVIDIDICPKCEQARQVYDCPAETCQLNSHSTNACRGCILCVARCVNCGCCLNDRSYEETISFDLLCYNCCPVFSPEGEFSVCPLWLRNEFSRGRSVTVEFDVLLRIGAM